WTARRIVSSIVEALSFLGSSYVFDSVAERAGVALEADCVLAIARVEWFGIGRRAPANLRYGRCDRIHFRITPGSLHPSVSHYRLPGLDKGRELRRRRALSLRHASLQLCLGMGWDCRCGKHADRPIASASCLFHEHSRRP